MLVKPRSLLFEVSLELITASDAFIPTNRGFYSSLRSVMTYHHSSFPLHHLETLYYHITILSSGVIVILLLYALPPYRKTVKAICPASQQQTPPMAQHNIPSRTPATSTLTLTSTSSRSTHSSPQHRTTSHVSFISTFASP